MPLFTDADRGKPVENDAGETVATVETVEGDVAHVRPNPDVVDSIKSSIGWDSRADVTMPLDDDLVAEVTDEAVRLEGGLEQAGTATGTSDAESTGDEDSDASRTQPAGGMSGTDETDLSEEMADDDETGGESDGGLEADPTELTDDASGFEVNPDDADDEFQRSDATVDPDEEMEPTDAEVEPDDDLEPTDAEVDPADERDGNR